MINHLSRHTELKLSGLYLVFGGRKMSFTDLKSISIVFPKDVDLRSLTASNFSGSRGLLCFGMHLYNYLSS